MNQRNAHPDLGKIADTGLRLTRIGTAATIAVLVVHVTCKHMGVY